MEEMYCVFSVFEGDHDCEGYKDLKGIFPTKEAADTALLNYLAGVCERRVRYAEKCAEESAARKPFLSKITPLLASSRLNPLIDGAQIEIERQHLIGLANKAAEAVAEAYEGVFYSRDTTNPSDYEVRPFTVGVIE